MRRCRMVARCRGVGWVGWTGMRRMGMEVRVWMGENRCREMRRRGEGSLLCFVVDEERKRKGSVSCVYDLFPLFFLMQMKFHGKVNRFSTIHLFFILTFPDDLRCSMLIMTTYKQINNPPPPILFLSIIFYSCPTPPSPTTSTFIFGIWLTFKLSLICSLMLVTSSTAFFCSLCNGMFYCSVPFLLSNGFHGFLVSIYSVCRFLVQFQATSFLWTLEHIHPFSHIHTHACIRPVICIFFDCFMDSFFSWCWCSRDFERSWFSFNQPIHSSIHPPLSIHSSAHSSTHLPFSLSEYLSPLCSVWQSVSRSVYWSVGSLV